MMLRGVGIHLDEYDPRWPDWFDRVAERVLAALGSRVLRIEHVGSTSVPGLAAKPVIDAVVVVRDSACEDEYVPPLEAAGFKLEIREPEWFEHRMFRGVDPVSNVHAFSEGCPEVGRMLLFRDWLRSNAADRELYARTKLELASWEWEAVQQYADAKSDVVTEIMAHAQRSPRV